MTFRFDNVYVDNTACVTGPYEKKGPLKTKFDKSYDDLYMNEKTFEDAEVRLMEESIEILLRKARRSSRDIDLIIGGDLLNQITATSYAVKKFNIPHLGIYSACSTSTEGIIIASSLIDSNYIKNAIVSTSSHNLTSEKQYRNPIEYGAPKPLSSTFTTTGGASVLLTNYKTKIKVESGTVGKICDMDQMDPNNMGANMAVAAGETIMTHLKDMKRDVNYYDLIITGDLGIYGMGILKDYLKNEYGVDLLNNYNDSGTMIYDLNKQKDVHAGGSGPACSPLVNYSYIFPLIEKGILKKVLIVATGALFSPTFIYQKHPILSISHAVSLESVK